MLLEGLGDTYHPSIEKGRYYESLRHYGRSSINLSKLLI